MPSEHEGINSDQAPLDFWERRKAIRESTLTVQQKLLLTVIADYEGQGECWASVVTLSRDVSLKERQTRYILSNLISDGIVLKTERSGQTSLLNVNWETLLPLQRSAGVHCTAGVHSGAPHPGTTVQGRAAVECTPPLQPTAAKPPKNIHLTSKEPPPPRAERDSGSMSTRQAWVEEVEEELISLGVDDIGCLQKAMAAGMVEPQIRELIRHFREHQSANGWKPQALHHRLSKVSPKLLSDRGWPTPSLGRQKPQSVEDTPESKAGRAKAVQEVQEKTQAWEKLESEFGEILNGMTKADQDKLLSRLRPVVFRNLRNVTRDQPAKFRQRRLELLKLLAADHQESISDEPVSNGSRTKEKRKQNAQPGRVRTDPEKYSRLPVTEIPKRAPTRG